MKLKIRIDSINPKHIHCTFFSDEFDKGTFANLGKLTMTLGEYQNIVCALLIGEERIGRFTLAPEDPKFKEFVEREVRRK